MLDNFTLRLIIALMGKLVDLGILELSRVNVIIKEHVNLSKRAILGLRKAEPAPKVAEEVGAGIKETSFGSPIPRGTLNHAGRDGIAKNSSEVVHKPPNHDCLVPQSPRWGLCYNGIANRSYSDHIGQGRNYQQDSNSQLNVLPVGKAETAYCHEAKEHKRHACHVDS